MDGFRSDSRNLFYESAADILNHVRWECDQINKEELNFIHLVRSENARHMMERIDGIVKMTDEKGTPGHPSDR